MFVDINTLEIVCVNKFKFNENFVENLKDNKSLYIYSFLSFQLVLNGIK